MRSINFSTGRKKINQYQVLVHQTGEILSIHRYWVQAFWNFWRLYVRAKSYRDIPEGGYDIYYHKDTTDVV